MQPTSILQPAPTFAAQSSVQPGIVELQRACNRIGHCDTGDAVITPGFNSKAKYIIHAVGPIWYGGTRGEKELLKRTYKKSLQRRNDRY